jgi:peptidase M1-like protein
VVRHSFLLVLLSAACVFAASPDVAELTRSIREMGLDPAACYRVRDLSFAKEDIRLYLTEGYLIFSKPVMGQRLAAVFTSDIEGGDGEVILIPPTRGERQSLASFTKAPNLDEHLRSALLISTEGSAVALLDRMQKDGTGKPAPEMGAILASQWSPVVSNISGAMEMRMIEDMSSSWSPNRGLLFLALSGKMLGNFDIISDSGTDGRIAVRQRNERDGKPGYNVWTSFFPRSVRNGARPKVEPDFTLSRYRIDAVIGADLAVKAVTRVAVRAGANPARAFPFAIARAMRVKSVRIDGQPAELLVGDSKRGRIIDNDLEDPFLVLAPEPLAAGSEHEFEFEHEGNVIVSQGDGVYFVNARGSWYPHVGSAFAAYDLTFRYPKRLTLVASGDPVEDRTEGDWRITHRRTTIPVGAAGFNLGDYEKVTGMAAGISFEVYGNRHLIDALRPRTVLVPAPLPGIGMRRRRSNPEPPLATEIAPLPPDPLARLRAVASDVSSSLEFYSGLFGPPALKTLTVAPIPGTFGQGFPGLVYLSTYAYLDPGERPAALRGARQEVFFSDLITAHEAAHQWWGSVVTSGSLDDDWLVEALANYSALMWLEKKKGVKARDSVLDGYRESLLKKDADGNVVESVGPIVWGGRLRASGTPDDWIVITYGKGAWILHMLRRRMGDERFLQMLAELRHRYEFRPVTTADFRMLAREFRPPRTSVEVMDTFFENWVDATGVPSLKVRYAVKGVAPSVKLSGAVSQTGVDDDFTMDVPVEIQFARGAPQIIWVRTSSDEQPFSAALRQAPVRVAIPNDVLMKK